MDIDVDKPNNTFIDGFLSHRVGKSTSKNIYVDMVKYLFFS